MVAVHPFPFAELEPVFRKIAKQEPITADERQLVQRRLDETPAADPAPTMTTCRVPAGPVLTALGVEGDVVYEAGPCEIDDFPPEVQATIRRFEAEKAAGRAKGVPHDEVVRQLEERIRREHGGAA